VSETDPDPAPRHRRPAAVYGVGTEPDARFSLANERTTLAWLRTALALVAAGIGLTSLAELAGLARWLDVVAAVLCLCGGGLAVEAVLGWRRTERALRLGGALPPPRALLWLGLLLVGLAVLLAGYAVGRLVG
jgi:putative membrane protein